MADDVFDSYDCKGGRKSEKRQGISKHKKGSGEEGARVAARRFQRLVRELMGTEGAKSNHEQDEPANEADPALFEGNEVGDARDPKGCDDAVDHITGCSAHPDHKAAPRAVFHRLADAEDADRSNRHRKRKPNDSTLHKMHDIHVIGSPDIARILSGSSTYIHDAHNDGIDRGLFLAIFARNTRPRAGSSGIRELCAGSGIWF